MFPELTPEQKALGQANFQNVMSGLSRHPSRRGFIKSVVAGAVAVPVGAAAYFGYQYEQMKKRPVRAALIGAGDEGGVLVGEHNPKYLEFVAYSDIRPYNQERIFKGEGRAPRLGFNHHYGDCSREDIKLFLDYRDLLKDDKLGIEAVVIALPLHLHAPVAIAAMRAGKHVLCEKLMAWNIDQCKQMIQVADETDRILTIGHQRHYSMLYAQAVEAIQSGVLGDIKHIRALWHRNNSWPRVGPDGKEIPGSLRDAWRPEIRKEDRAALEADITGKWDYKSMEELVRWRLYNRTGGGLMAELGSHQLDACSIFLTANAKKNYPNADFKLHPLAVSGVGGKMFYDDDREVEDQVFVTFEFPGPNYYQWDNNGRPARDKDGKLVVKKPNDIVVVTYSSINTNSFEAYGESIMGSRGTMAVEGEARAMLWAEKDPNVKDDGSPRSMSVTVSPTAPGNPPLETSASSGGADPIGPAAGPAGGGRAAGPVSRGYREEMEHFAYCVRMHEQAKDDMEKKRWRLAPRCHGRIAMADAIIALTANQAMKNHARIVFDEKWFEAAAKEVPDKDMKPVDSQGKAVQL